jgi:cytochrome P450
MAKQLASNADKSELMVAPNCPVSDIDLYDDQNLLNPYINYQKLRDLGGVVYLSEYDLYALPRHATTLAALTDWETFSSAKGVMLNDVMNDFMRGTLLCSDPPEHDIKRKVIMRPLTPGALKSLQDEITEEAETLVDGLVSQGGFNAAKELAQHLPMTIVSRKVGLPPAERAQMLRWAPAAFNCTGPISKDRTTGAFPVLEEVGEFIQDHGKRDMVTPGSWLDGLYKCADEGLIPHEQCAPMSFDYIAPALDTTISATSSAILYFARNPDQWALLREKPSLIPNAINEVVRIESPIQGWTRFVTRDAVIDGVTIPAGARVLVMFGSANRDERAFKNPERFDISRKVTSHVGFGHGEHGCAGANLARMEIAALLKALLARVERFELVEEPQPELNNTARVWRQINVRVIKAGI